MNHYLHLFNVILEGGSLLCWTHINTLRGGLGNTKGASADPLFHAKDGTPSVTRAESNSNVKAHWHSEAVFNMDSSPDLATLHTVPQRPVRSDLDGLPTDAEIIKTTRKAKKDRSPGDNKIPAELWCALVGTNKELETEEGQEVFDI
jgi:hypothetical protein